MPLMKPKKPKVNVPPLSPEWEAIKEAYIAGIAPKDLSAKFSKTASAIRSRATFEQWPSPKRMNKILKTGVKPDMDSIYRANVSENTTIARNLAVESWAARGADHRENVFTLASSALKKNRLTKITSWKDAEIADKMARRAAGLKDDAVPSAVVNFGMFGGNASNHLPYVDAEDADEAE